MHIFVPDLDEPKIQKSRGSQNPLTEIMIVCHRLGVKDYLSTMQGLYWGRSLMTDACSAFATVFSQLTAKDSWGINRGLPNDGANPKSPRAAGCLQERR